MEEREIRDSTEEEALVLEKTKKQEHPEDVALLQCLLCLLLVVSGIGLHWISPTWQQTLLEQYRIQREALPVEWVVRILEQVEQWGRG
jgi:hypothetical protein